MKYHTSQKCDRKTNYKGKRRYMQAKIMKFVMLGIWYLMRITENYIEMNRPRSLMEIINNTLDIYNHNHKNVYSTGKQT